MGNIFTVQTAGSRRQIDFLWYTRDFMIGSLLRSGVFFGILQQRNYINATRRRLL